MHYEILVEGQSELTLLSTIMPQILGAYNEPHTRHAQGQHDERRRLSWYNKGRRCKVEEFLRLDRAV